jgi:DNA-binding NarL/FixJ family response regulator
MLHIPIKIIIADDHKIFRSGLHALLKNIPRIKVIREAQNGREVLEILSREHIDIVLMDITMPELNGIEATRLIKEKYPDVKVIALSMHDDPKTILEMNTHGACGYLLKNTDITELELAIQTVMKNENYWAREVARTMFEMLQKKEDRSNGQNRLETINDKDRELIRYICEGYSAAEIAKKMGVAEKTVEGKKSKLFQKTGATNVASLVMYAVKNNIVNS